MHHELVLCLVAPQGSDLFDLYARDVWYDLLLHAGVLSGVVVHRRTLGQVKSDLFDNFVPAPLGVRLQTLLVVYRIIDVPQFNILCCHYFIHVLNQDCQSIVLTLPVTPSTVAPC